MPPPSRSAAIAAELRDEILRGQYRPGERLPSERDLAERFAVHRSAVREALKCLDQLGLADIRPGGARVIPVEEASLDIVEHLLGLEDPPDPAIVDQVLEVMGGLFSMAARLCAERASDEERAAIRKILDQLAVDERSTRERVQLMHQLGDVFVEASGNLVLKLVRGGVKTHFVEHVQPPPNARLAPLVLREPVLKSIADAIESHDGAGAAEAVLELSRAIRRHALESIMAAGARREVETETQRNSS